MHKLKFIGPKYMIEPLKIIGIETFSADSEKEAAKALSEATSKREPALIFMSERLSLDLQEEINRLNKKAEINIVLIPDNQGSIGIASNQIQNLLKNSIGAEVIERK